MKFNDNVVPIEYLRTCFSYDSDSGILTWLPRADMPRPWNRKMGGKAAGTRTKSGLAVRIFFSGKTVRLAVHRVAWCLYYGSWPDCLIDHENNDNCTNNIDNLRQATFSTNGANVAKIRSKHGRKGVVYNSESDKYVAVIGKNNKTHNLGYFDTPEEAGDAYDRAAVRLYGEFARTNAQILGAIR